METPKESTSCIPAEKNSLLIEEVKKFPSLYDTSDPNYYILAERNKSWIQVADNCNEPAELCHLRWKSLRKRYAKEKRRIPEILQGSRRPWVLFPKMSFLTPTGPNRRIRPKPRRRLTQSKQSPTPLTFKQNPSDDDMLIVDDNDEIVRTCKAVEMSEEDEYIYETLEDPDSALEIMKGRPVPKTKQMAIRSGGAANLPIGARIGSSGRIRKLTPKMQNSIIAKKLKQAQQVLQQSSFESKTINGKSSEMQKKVATNNNNIDANKSNPDKTVLYQDRTTRHVATVNPNIIRIEKLCEKDQTSPLTHDSIITIDRSKREPGATLETNRPFKVVKLKGRNPIIFSPEQLPEIQSFLKSESSPIKDPPNLKTPLIKVKSVDFLNNQSQTPPKKETDEDSNLDIIHSVGLMRKNTSDKGTSVEKVSNQNYSRAYSWNRPSVKVANKQTSTENIQPDSQTQDYEIEESWNAIKEENIDDTSWQNYSDPPNLQSNELLPMDFEHRSLNRVNEAELELVAYKKRLLEEQHKKTLEYMKKEHDLKMTLLRAEIDLKRKQLNIML